MPKRNPPLLPFIATEQCALFTDIFGYVREMGRIGLFAGVSGCGKSEVARHYAATQPRMTANGMREVLYCELRQSTKTDRALYNKLNAIILRLPQPENLTGSIAEAKTVDLVRCYRYQGLIFDEFGFLDRSGLEAIRTLYDALDIPIMLITMPDRVYRLRKVDALRTRIVKPRVFQPLTPAQLCNEILPRVSPESHLRFDPKQPDAMAMAKTLHLHARCGRFRLVVEILEQANNLIELSCENRQRHQVSGIPEAQLPPIVRFNEQLIEIAAAQVEGALGQAKKDSPSKEEDSPSEDDDAEDFMALLSDERT